MRGALCCGAIAMVIWPGVAVGDIGIELRPFDDVVEVGGTLGVGVYVVSETAEEQLLAGAQVIVGWAPGYLRLSGTSGVGAAPLLYSGFPWDPYGLNEANPPRDGMGMYMAFANLGNPLSATPEGTLLTTLVFEAMSESSRTTIDVVMAGGSPEGRTVVYDGTVPNRDVTGALRGAAVTVIASPPAGAGLLFCAASAARRRRFQ